MQKTMRQLTEKEALNKLAALCSRSEHCASELQEKMARWGIGEEAQERVIAALVKEKFIDEERYARAFASDKARYDKWGSRKISQALRMKRISDAAVEEALAEVEDEVYEDALRQLLKAKLRSTKAKDDYELSCKLIRFAMGRGFGMEEIKKCLTEVFREAEFED